MKKNILLSLGISMLGVILIFFVIDFLKTPIFINSFSKINDFENTTVTLSAQDKKTYIKYAYQVIDQAFTPVKELNQTVPELKNYDKLYISLMNNNQLRCCQKGLTNINNPSRTKLDIEEAIDRCLKDERYGGEIKQEEITNLEIVFNILHNKSPVNKEKLNQEIELGIHAIELVNGSKSVFFKESVPITKNYDLDKTLERLCVKSKLSSECYKQPNIDLYKYEALTFKSDRSEQITDLYRYNVFIDPADINNDLLDERLNLTKSWFLNNINPETNTIEYTYYPSKDTYSDKNNHVRQLATIWSVTELKKYLNDDPDFDLVIANTIDLYSNFLKCPADYCYLEIDGKSKIAYNAFLLMALINTPEYPESPALQEKLAKGLVFQQQANGSFYTYFNSDSTSGEKFYPGEALLSLMKYYQQTDDSLYLDTAQKAFYYYRNYWRNNKNSAFIPWHTQAYALLYQQTKKKEIADFIFEINDWLIANRQVQDSPYPDEIGGYPKPEPGNATGVDTEGMNAAYQVAKLVGDKEHQEKYLNAIKYGTRYILLLQYTPESAIGIKNKERAIGGFRDSLVINAQRLDFNQHCLLALIWGINNEIFK